MKKKNIISTLSKDNQYKLLFEVNIDSELISHILEELINDNTMKIKIYKLHCWEYGEKYANNPKYVVLNRVTSFKRVEEVDQEKDKDGFVWAERKCIYNEIYYTFDLLNEKASILYKDIMNLDNNDFDSIITIINNYHLLITNNTITEQENQLLNYYKKLVSAISIKFLQRSKVVNVDNNIGDEKRLQLRKAKQNDR